MYSKSIEGHKKLQVNSNSDSKNEKPSPVTPGNTNPHFRNSKYDFPLSVPNAKPRQNYVQRSRK